MPALGEAVPDESTIRKLTRRLGAEAVDEITRVVIGKAQRETRFRARAVRIDSTVIEADVRYPTDSGLALDSARVLARGARKLAARVGRDAGWVRDRSRAFGRRVGGDKPDVGPAHRRAQAARARAHEQAGKLVARSIAEAKRLATVARTRRPVRL